MFSKSSYKYGERLLTNTMAGGIRLIGSLFSSTSNMSNPMFVESTHFNTSAQKVKYIICGVLALMCPVAGFVSYYNYGWLMFFSILVFGFVGLIINLITAFQLIDNKFIYTDEVEQATAECRKILNIHKAFTVAVACLNVYPFVFIVAQAINPPPSTEIKISFLSLLLAVLQFGLSVAFAAGAFADYKRLDEGLPFKRRTRKETSKPVEVKQKKIPVVQSEIKLPKITGEYVETLDLPHGKLHIERNSASIQFYFPGPDARYNGTVYMISEDHIDQYIHALIENWKSAKQLHETAKNFPDAELKQTGLMDMRIVATSKYSSLCFFKYHLEIYSEERYQNVLNVLQMAKLRIVEVRSKLFV